MRGYTPILSFLALVAILWTIHLQNNELKLTRQEMKESQDAFEIQNFEKTFFEMLHLLGSIVEDISIVIEDTEQVWGSGLPTTTVKGKTITGRACFKYLRDELQRIYNEEAWSKTINPGEYPKYIQQAYDKFARHHEHVIGHYFRFLYRIFKHVDSSDPSKKLKIDKKLYAGIARAMLSSNELALLFYDCFYHKGKKFAELIIEHSLFENMEFEKLFDKEHHIPLFALKAYGDEDWSRLIYDKSVPVHFGATDTATTEK